MSKREEEKAIEAAKKVAEEAKRTEEKLVAAETLQEATTQRFQESINKSIEETKKNVRKSIEETRSQIPQYTTVVKNYQEQAIESTRKLVEDYLETQKLIINTVFETAIPYYENVNRMYNYWLFPKVPTELWTRAVSNIAENISAATRTGNDILFGNIDAFGSALERAQRQTEVLSRININNAKTIANTAKETAAVYR
jgi:inorganic triphosphatase YgiF